MATGVSVPLELAGVLCAGFALAGIWAGRVLSGDARGRPPRPLRAARTPDVTAQAIDLAARRSSMRGASQAVLHGRVRPLGMRPSDLDSESRKQMCDHVAAVMRASLRPSDRVTLAEGDGFTIVLPGTDERSAIRIADRLRHKLARVPWHNLSAGPGLSARFGVAAGRHGQPVENIAARARRALNAAWDHRNDHVVPASAIEEILLLPPPVAAVSAAA